MNYRNAPYCLINYLRQKLEAFQSVHHVTFILCYTVLKEVIRFGRQNIPTDKQGQENMLRSLMNKINEKYGTHFTEMDKVLVQMENDYANQEKWQSYAKNNDRATFMLLFEKDFPNMAADRYEQNDKFFRKLFDDPDMMKQVMKI